MDAATGKRSRLLTRTYPGGDCPRSNQGFLVYPKSLKGTPILAILVGQLATDVVLFQVGDHATPACLLK